MVDIDRDATTVASPPLVRPQRFSATQVSVALSVLTVVVASVLTYRAPAVPGLNDPGAVTTLGLPVVRALATFAATGAIGTLLLLGWLLTGPEKSAADTADRARRLTGIVGGWAGVWAAAAFGWVLLVASDVAAVPAVQLVTDGTLLDVVGSLSRAQALLSMAWVAAVLCFAALLRPTIGTTFLMLFAAIGGLLPPLYTSHPGHEENNHEVAVVSLLAHVPAAAVWVGSLLAIVLYARRHPATLAYVVPNFSRVAGVCYAVLLASGSAAAWARVPQLSDLVTTEYGRLILLKIAVAAVLGIFGAVHRRRTVRAAAAGRPGALLRLATVEVVLMTVVLGVAAALAGSPPPT